LFVRMADKRARHRVFFAVRRLHARGRELEWLANAGVTDFTAVDDVGSVDTDLMAEDRVIVVGHLGLQAFDGDWAKTDKMVLQIVVTFLRKLGWSLQQLCFFAKRSGLLIAKLIVKCFKLSVIEFLVLNGFSIIRRQRDSDLFFPLRFGLILITLFRTTSRGFDVVADDGETAALILERVCNRVELALSGRYLRVDLLYFRLDCFAGSLLVSLELLILRTLFDLSFALAGVVFN